jgi:beta-mannosidase
VSIQENRENFWAYRQDVSRFPNEGGVLGVSSPATLRQFLPEDERYYLSPSWEYHQNTFGWRQQISELEIWLDSWLGMDPAQMSLEDLAYYSGVLQAEALVEYINNYRRRMFSTAAAIFWMYNDSWPASDSWTIVDYYLRRKLSYHPVRRAFDPLQIIPVVEDEHMRVYGVNDTLQPWHGEARYGLARFDGRDMAEEDVAVTLEPNAATFLGEMPLSLWEERGYSEWLAYATLLEEDRVIRQNRLLLARYKEIEWPEPRVQVSRSGERVSFLSDVYAWGVCIDPEGEVDLPDDVFDLLPGVPYTMPWPQDRELPKVARVANYRPGK